MNLKRTLKWTPMALAVVLFAWFEFAYWSSTNDCGAKAVAPASAMRAIRYCEYGAPDDVLKIAQVEKPVPNESQVLVRVRGVSLRFFDSGMIRGGIGRLMFGLRKPRNPCPGSNFAGTVEAVGAKVTDVIFDLISDHSFSERKRVLTPNGICVLGIGGAGWHEDIWRRVIGNFIDPLRSRLSSRKFVMYIATLKKADMTFFRELMESGKVKPAIDRTFTLAEVPEAVRYLEKGHAGGKVVIHVVGTAAEVAAAAV